MKKTGTSSVISKHLSKRLTVLVASIALSGLAFSDGQKKEAKMITIAEKRLVECLANNLRPIFENGDLTKLPFKSATKEESDQILREGQPIGIVYERPEFFVNGYVYYVHKLPPQKYYLVGQGGFGGSTTVIWGPIECDVS